MIRSRRCPVCELACMREKFEVCPLCSGARRIVETYVPEGDRRPGRVALGVLGAIVVLGLALRAALVVLVGR
jgi:hypothetical protein